MSRTLRELDVSNGSLIEVEVLDLIQAIPLHHVDPAVDGDRRSQGVGARRLGRRGLQRVRIVVDVIGIALTKREACQQGEPTDDERSDRDADMRHARILHGS